MSLPGGRSTLDLWSTVCGICIYMYLFMLLFIHAAFIYEPSKVAEVVGVPVLQCVTYPSDVEDIFPPC